MNNQIPTAPPVVPPQPYPVSGGAYGWPTQPRVPSKVALARWLVVLAVAGIGGRLLVMAACANRISFADDLLNGGVGTVDDANQADHLVTTASLIAVAVFLGFVGVLIAVGRRAKRGDVLCAAINSTPAVKLTSRIYAVSIVASMFLHSIFKQDQSASPEDQVRAVVHGDWASIALNGVVIVFLVVVAVVTRREMAKARLAAAAG